MKKLDKIFVAMLSLSMGSTSLTSCSKISDFFQNVGDVANNVIDTIKDWGSEAWENTLDWGSDTWDTVSNWGKSTWTQVVDWGTNTGEAVAQWGETVIDGTKNFFCSVGDYILDIANDTIAFGLRNDVNDITFSDGLEEDGKEEDWNSYSDDFEAISYSLITTQLEKVYDVFPATIEIPSTHQEIHGYAFTDYETTYTYHKDQDDQKNYYGTGFISLVDELEIPETDIQQGIEIKDVESSDSSKHYIYSYDCNSFQTHCVVKGQYLKYGVNADHQIYYSNTDYNGSYDTSLGGLYSFDEKKYIYGEENGFTPQKGSIIAETLDTESYEKETKNAFLSGVSIAFKDFKNIISGSVSIVKTLFDKLDAQTIFGYKIGDLKKAVSNTNEDDIATVTDKKVAIHSVDNEVPSTLKATAKWIVALCTCVVLISSIVLPLIFKATAIVLPLKVILASLRTASIKSTLQTIVKNKNFTDVNWIYIAFSSVVSGITAIINIKKETPIAKIITKKIRKTSLKFMKKKALSSFSLVSCLALAIHLSSTICRIYKGLLNCVSKVSPTISNKISTAIKNKTLTITNNLEDSTNESTKTVVAEQTADSVEQASTDSDTVSFMTQKSIQSLPSEENSYFAITNENGDSISKAEFLKNDGNGYLTLKNVSSGNKYASSFINQKGETLNRISIKNGSVQFQEINSISVSTSSWKSLIGSRTDNIKILDDSLKNMIINDSSKVSSDVRNYFTNKGVAFENLSYSDFDDMRRDLNKTWHECEDRTTGLLIDNTIHNAISHIDGYSLIKAITAYYFPGKIVLTAK